ncbi:MAG: DNA adenine methylase [Pirellulales bacterium]
MAEMQKPLFSDDTLLECADVTGTEGIKYIGSKRLLIPHILDLIKPLGVQTVFDGFAGSTRVSQALAKRGYRVTANDISVWSRVFATCYLRNTQPPSYYARIIEHLNGLPGRDGWFTEHYGGEPNDGSAVQKDGRKRIWQIHNTRKLDAIREEIDRVTTDEVERSVLLTSLIIAMDKVDSTVGHQVSYLREWAPRAYLTMKMTLPQIWRNEQVHEVHQADIFDLLEDVETDLAYFDPPYGSSNEKMPPSRVRYASYYHLWTTICRNDQPKLVGVANRRADVSDKHGSIFEEFRRGPSGRYLVIEAIERLVQSTKARYILLSYSNQGRMTTHEMAAMLDSLGKEHKVVEVGYKANVMEGMRWTNEWIDEAREATKEFLFLIVNC